MKKYIIVSAAFLIMLCLGGVYAWSLVASELMADYGFTAVQSQIIFGAIIAVFPLTMIFAGRLSHRVRPRSMGYMSGMLFLSGYSLAANSGGDFLLTFLGIGMVAGIATGLGYWVSLTVPVQWFPEKKGLVTGIAAAGFGLGAVALSLLTEPMLESGYSVLDVLQWVGIVYGGSIILLSGAIVPQHPVASASVQHIGMGQLVRSRVFAVLFAGIFLGTFAGLLVIGNLKLIGAQCAGCISNHILILGVSMFAVSNFLGRLVWGFLSDRIGANLCVALALGVQSLAIVFLDILPQSPAVYLVLSFLIGFGFGGNFVLFARETAQIFGLQQLGIIYPYVLIGYSVAGIAGPVMGGYLFDTTGTFFYAVILASTLSFIGSVLFFHRYMSNKYGTAHPNKY